MIAMNDGSLLEKTAGFTNSNVTGVYINDGEGHEFIIAPVEWVGPGEYVESWQNPENSWWGNSGSAWGSQNIQLSNIVTSTSLSNVITDFNGSNNTSEMIKQLMGIATEDMTGSAAAEYCRAYSNGHKDVGQWYLPSAGEMSLMVENQEDIDFVLNRIGGETLEYHGGSWTSNQHSKTGAWGYTWYTDSWWGSTGNKESSCGVRPICKVSDENGQIITFKIGTSQYLATYPMNVADWVDSTYNTDGYKLDSAGFLCDSSNHKIREDSLTYMMDVTVFRGGYTYIIEESNSSITVDLNNQWQPSSKSNPDSSLYDIYESYSNYNVDDESAIMTITITGYIEFTCYIRSYAEACCDYVMISQLDQNITGDSSYSDTTLVKSHTRNNSQSGTALSNYTKVTYSGIDGGTHTITVVYKKDYSVNNYDDKGYILVPKSNNDNDTTTDTQKITWSILSGTWTSSSSSSAADGEKWTCSSPGSDNSTVIRCTFNGITNITFNCLSQGENNWDYLTVGALDSSCERGIYETSLQGSSGTARDITYSCDTGQHYVEFCYSKDSSVDTNPDNAIVYIKSYS